MDLPAVNHPESCVEGSGSRESLCLDFLLFHCRRRAPWNGYQTILMSRASKGKETRGRSGWQREAWRRGDLICFLSRLQLPHDSFGVLRRLAEGGFPVSGG